MTYNNFFLVLNFFFLIFFFLFFYIGEEQVVHTNQIEGGWKHAKQHFRKISGTTLPHFEGHLAEIMWRNYVSTFDKNIFQAFFSLLKSVYDLRGKPQYTYQSPMFPTWSQTSADDDLERSFMIPDANAQNG